MRVNMGFTKLDEGILQSSIMAEPPEVFKVWIVMLAACGPDGIARISPVYVSSICHLPLSTVMDSIKILDQPDPMSRSTADEGRRIRRVDGGWYIINYTKYRAATYSYNPEAVRKREYRKNTQKTPKIGTALGHCPDASASASSSESLREVKDRREDNDKSVDESVSDMNKLLPWRKK